MPQYTGNINQTEALSNTGKEGQGHKKKTVHVNVAKNHRENPFKCNPCYRAPAPQLNTRLPAVMVTSLCLVGSINYTQTYTDSRLSSTTVIFLKAFSKPIR